MREYKVEERIAVLSDNGKGVTKELNRVSFDGKPALLDMRRWVDGKPKKGISLTSGEAALLFLELRKIYKVVTRHHGKEPDGNQQ